MKKAILPLIIVSLASPSLSQNALDSLRDSTKIQYLERVFDDAQGACDRVVGRPNISPFPENSLDVANRLFDTIFTTVDEFDPLPTDVDANDQLLADGIEMGLWIAMYSTAQHRHSSLSDETHHAEACNYLNAIFHGNDAQVESINQYFRAYLESN